MSTPQLGDVARVCGRYPDIQLEHSLPRGATYAPGDPVEVVVELQRSQEGELPPVDAPRSVFTSASLKTASRADTSLGTDKGLWGGLVKLHCSQQASVHLSTHSTKQYCSVLGSARRTC